MTQIIVFENPEDASRVFLLTPTGELSIDELIQRHVDIYKPYKIMDEGDLPQEDNIYFAAWQLINDNIVINLEKAKDIHRNMLRQQRTERFASLDVAFMRALEQGDTVKQQEIALQKQKLRDIPSHPAIYTVEDTTQLRALTLDFLLEN